MYEVPCGVYNRGYKEDLAVVRTRSRWILFVIGIAIFLVSPFWISESSMAVINTMAIWVVAAFGLNLLTGFCGEISIGHAAFMGIGAYVSAILTGDYELSFWLALPLSGLAAGAAGLIFALPSTRLKGFYLAIVTLAAQVIVVWVLSNWKSVTGGFEGLETPYVSIGGWEFESEISWYYLSIIMAFVMGIIAHNIGRSNVGRAFVAIRDNDLAAEVMGINLFKYKSIAFFSGCGFAGFSGCLWAHYAGHISPEFFNLHESIWFLGMIIVGGMGKTMGPVFGVVFIFLLKRVITISVPVISEYLPSMGAQALSSLGLMTFGVVVAFFLIIEPRGIAHWWDKVKNFYRIWPFSY